MEQKRELIELHLQEMRQAAEMQQYDLVETNYKRALESAKRLVGEEAPLLLLMMCMARYYEAQDKMVHAEAFNRKARNMLLMLPEAFETAE